MKGKPGKTLMSGFGNEAAQSVIGVKTCTGCGLCIKVCKTFTIIAADENRAILAMIAGHLPASCTNKMPGWS